MNFLKNTFSKIGVGIGALGLVFLPQATFAASPLAAQDITDITTAVTGMATDLVGLFVDLTPVIVILAVMYMAISWVKKLARGRIS